MFIFPGLAIDRLLVWPTLGFSMDVQRVAFLQTELVSHSAITFLE